MQRCGMDPNRLTEKARAALVAAQELADAQQHSQVEPEHLLVTLLEQEGGIVPELVRQLGADAAALAREARRDIGAMPKVHGATQLYLSTRLSRVLSAADDEAKRLKDEYVSTEHLLLALCAAR